MILGLINLGLKIISGLIGFAQTHQLMKAGEAKVYVQLMKDMQDATEKAIKLRNSTDDTVDNDELLVKPSKRGK